MKHLRNETARAVDISPPGAPAPGPDAHGGDLAAARRRFPLAPQPWLDLSTGVNPRPYPFRPPPAEALTRLPEPCALAALEAAAAAAYGAPAHVRAIAAPGTQAVIGLMPHLVPARRVGVLGFTYFEHARAWAEGGAAVTTVDDVDALAEHDVGVVVNPNNPDGHRLAPSRLAALAQAFARRGRLLVVDEAFADFEPRRWSFAPELPRSGAVVLRSFGKAYGLPGLRLGFALAPDGLAARLRAALGCWPVSGTAIAIGHEALEDRGWLEASRQELAADGEKLDALLGWAGLSIVGGTSLFRLVEAQDASERFLRLAEAGIWVRRFRERPRWLRLAIPSGDGARARLETALRPAGGQRAPR